MEAVAQDADEAAQPITAYLNTAEIVGQISEWVRASRLRRAIVRFENVAGWRRATTDLPPTT